MKKKLLSVLFILAITINMMACGIQEKQVKSSENPEIQEQNIKEDILTKTDDEIEDSYEEDIDIETNDETTSIEANQLKETEETEEIEIMEEKEINTETSDIQNQSQLLSEQDSTEILEEKETEEEEQERVKRKHEKYY